MTNAMYYNYASWCMGYEMKAFTLIELLVIISIISLLSVTASSAFKTYVAKTKVIKTVNLVRSVVGAKQEEYFAKNGRFGSRINVGLPGVAGGCGSCVSLDIADNPTYLNTIIMQASGFPAANTSACVNMYSYVLTFNNTLTGQNFQYQGILFGLSDGTIREYCVFTPSLAGFSYPNQCNTNYSQINSVMSANCESAN